LFVERLVLVRGSGVKVGIVEIVLIEVIELIGGVAIVQPLILVSTVDIDHETVRPISAFVTTVTSIDLNILHRRLLNVIFTGILVLL
jgi:hypothetical protein